MIASVQIASVVRTFPDAAPASSEGSEGSTPANFQSVLRQYHSPAEQDSEESSDRSNSHQAQQDPGPVRPVTLAQQQNATLASKADPKASPLVAPAQEQDATESSRGSAASSRGNLQSTLRKYRSSLGPDSPSDAIPGSGQKDTDLTRTVAVLATHSMEPHVILPLTASLTLRQDGTAQQSDSAGSQGAMTAPETDQTVFLPTPQLRVDDAATPLSASIAFAARLSPDADLSAADALRNPAQASLQAATQTATKQVATGANQSADARSGEGGDPSSRQNAGDLFAKPETLSSQTTLMQTSASGPDHAALQMATDVHNDAGADVRNKETPATLISPMARMDRVIEPPTAPSSANHDITVRIPDASEQGTAVRFVERGGEVHVTVRTGDTEMAQTLRGGLNDLVNRLQDGGIRTEVWQPGSDSSSSQDDHRHPFADPDGSNGNPPSSHSEQESRQQNKPRWVEELEGSIGNENMKETPQILWQA